MKKILLMAALLCGLLWTADVTAQTPTLWPSGAEIWVYVEKPSTTSDMKVYEENYLGQMVRLDRDQIQDRVITYFMQCLNSWKGFCDLNLTFRKYLDGTAPHPNAQYKISIEMASVSGGHFFGEQTPPLQVGSEIRSQGGLNPNGNVISYDFVSSVDNNFVYTPPPYEYFNHVDLKTVLFHEAGHAMGMPHVPIDNNIYRPVDRPAMYEGYQGVIRAANAHDKDIFKSLYNNNGGSCPPYMHTYVQNSFLGGQVYVDYQHDNNQDGLKTIPVLDANNHSKNYYSLNWPENSAPTVSAIDGQVAGTDVMRYVHWFDGALNVKAKWIDDQYDITFNNTDNGELWQAYFRNQINLAFVQPVDCMGQTVDAQYVITSNSGSPVAQTSTFTNYAQAYYVEGRTTVFSVEVQPLAGHTFLMWSDGQSSNPREFAPTSDLQVYAICAPHLGSDHLNDDMESVGPTASNNQRKIMYVEGSPGYHHQVYESCGYILYSRSSDNGWHWEPELPVSMLSADASRPSLYADVTGVYVVWCEGSLVRVAEVDPDNRTVNYYPISQLPLARNNATPVIAHTDYTPDSEVIVVYEWDNSCEIIGVLFENGQYVNTFSPSYYSCVQGDQVHPSITKDNTYHQLVWRDGDEVWFREFTVNGVPGGPPVLMFPAYEEKVPMGNRSAMGAPSIAVNRNTAPCGIIAAVACETGTVGNSGISVTLRQYGGWTHVQTFLGAGEMGRLWAPSVSMIDQPSQTSAYENFRMGYNQTYPYFNPTDRSVHAMMP